MKDGMKYRDLAVQRAINAGCMREGEIKEWIAVNYKKGTVSMKELRKMNAEVFE